MKQDVPPLPPEVLAVFNTAPAPAQLRLKEMRALIFQAAADSETGPLLETLKWGQPSYLTQASKSGTTIRLGWSDKHPDHCGLYVHCGTDLVDRYRQMFPTEFTYQTDRAVLVPVSGDIPTEALRRIASMALTYHRDKKNGAAP